MIDKSPLWIKVQFCATLFIDLSRIFDISDHKIFLHKLQSIGLDEVTLNWFHYYLTERIQTFVADGT